MTHPCLITRHSLLYISGCVKGPPYTEARGGCGACVWLRRCAFVHEHSRPSDKVFIIISSLHDVLMNYADTIELSLQNTHTYTERKRARERENVWWCVLLKGFPHAWFRVTSRTESSEDLLVFRKSLFTAGDDVIVSDVSSWLPSFLPDLTQVRVLIRNNNDEKQSVNFITN